MTDDLADSLASVGALAEPTRRALYRYVTAQPQPVSREQAAGAVGLPLHTAKFHLDRLVDEGLLDTEFRRLSGRTGPGAGRPSKLYRRSAREVSVSLPERRYDLAGEVLAEAIDQALRDDQPISSAVGAAAETEGRRIAGQAIDEGMGVDRLETAVRILAGCGYEPRVHPAEVRLANCPFHRLVAGHTELVCGMNLALIGGVIDALGLHMLRAELDPEPGCCCVRIRGLEAHL